MFLMLFSAMQVFFKISFLVWEGIKHNSKERKIIYSLVPKALQQVNVSISTVRVKRKISIVVMTLVCNVSIKPCKFTDFFWWLSYSSTLSISRSSKVVSDWEIITSLSLFEYCLIMSWSGSLETSSSWTRGFFETCPLDKSSEELP